MAHKPIKGGINNPIPEDPKYVRRGRKFNTGLAPEEYKYVGKAIPRKDSKDIVTGKALFLDDFALPDMLIGKFMRSPYSHAIITHLDASKAEALPGVKAILTHVNFPGLGRDVRFGFPPHKPFLDAHLRYIGDPVAMVAAVDEETALAAIDLIEVEYEVLPAVYDGLSAVADGAPQLYEEFDHNVVPGGFPVMQSEGAYWHLMRGDVDAGFEECEHIVEDTVAFNKMCAPASPEPPGAVVRWDGGNTFTCWTASQSTDGPRTFNATVLVGATLHVQTFNVGGSYGNKQTIGYQVCSAALLSLVCGGRPVKVMQTKVEQLMAFETRLGSQVKARIGIDKDGIIRAVKGKWTVDCGGICNATQGQVAVGIGEAQIVMAKCQNWDFDSALAVSNKQPAGCVRGYGGQELNSCLALLMARAMQEGDFDPVDIYKKNYVSDGDFYIWRDGLPWRAHTVNYVPIIERAAERFGWKETWKGWHKPTWTSEDGRYVRGVGCAIIGNADVGEDTSEAYVRIVPDLYGTGIKVYVHADITESGMGQRSSILRVVAESLDVPYENITIVRPESDINPIGIGLCGSRGTITYGHALANACEDLKQKLFQACEGKLHITSDLMEIRGGYVYSHTMPGNRIPIKHVQANSTISFTGYGKHVENFSIPSCVMCFVEVQVDKETGKVDVLRLLTATDCGQIMDPAAIEMQLQGGIGAACMDTATFEENIIDPTTGRPMTYNMIESKWRTFNNFPEHESVIMESRPDSFQFNAVGVGEISGASSASAIMMAISDAIGVNVAEYPATPGVILRALGKM
jgi:CO/xanthine dehydrogenase Mo-binding subunit